jgi:uncharacterized protein (TIGR02246 family)
VGTPRPTRLRGRLVEGGRHTIYGHGAADRIRALDEGWAWAWAAAARDLDGMMAIYAEDARELLPGLPAAVGREAIRAFYQGVIERLPRFSHHFEPLEVVVAESEDLAVVRGAYRFTADSTHPERVETGEFVALNISNSDHPPH